ncbi:MAG: hypothetical protein ABWY05_05150 [Noviherbaspirillum sp.]
MNYFLTAALCLALTTAEAAAPPKYPTKVPPPAELTYAVKARQSGMSIDGESRMVWLPAGKRYTLGIETRAMLVSMPSV